MHHKKAMHHLKKAHDHLEKHMEKEGHHKGHHGRHHITAHDKAVDRKNLAKARHAR